MAAPCASATGSILLRSWRARLSQLGASPNQNQILPTRFASPSSASFHAPCAAVMMMGQQDSNNNSNNKQQQQPGGGGAGGAAAAAAGGATPPSTAEHNPLGVSESLASRVRDLDLLKTKGFIGGEWASAPDGASYEVTNPADGSRVATVARLGADAARAAVAAAHAAFPAWAALPAKSRCAALRRWHDLILASSDDIAAIMTAECGKPLAEAKAEIAAGAASVEWFAEQCRRVTGDVLETPSRDRRMLVLRQPVGVVAAITPWNFPMSMVSRKVAPALAAGCPVVLKPAEATPLTALALAELGARAGLPDGVFNVVSGDAPAIGNALTASETVRKLGFTGSTAVGKKLAAAAASTAKRLSLELGGNAPFLVFPDADLALAARGVVASALRNAGQTCICVNRAFVHESVADEFARLVAERVKMLKAGDGSSAETTLGPLISRAAVDKTRAHAADAVSKGAVVVAGGAGMLPEGLPEALARGGNWHAATVLDKATIDMRCFREETFGPLIPIFRFSTEDEAVALANDTEYGLAAYFYTRDLARAWKIAERLEYGMVGVNEIAVGSEVAPFGGVKQSGYGVENSARGLEDYLVVKYVCMGLGGE